MEKSYKSIQIGRLFLRYLSFVFGAILVITILLSIYYFNVPLKQGSLSCACYGCPCDTGEYWYTQILFIYFTTQVPWIVIFNIVAIVIILFLQIFFKKISNRSMIQNPNISKNQILVDNSIRQKYEGKIFKRIWDVKP